MRTYTQEEKQAVIDRAISGEPSARILADTGIPRAPFTVGYAFTKRSKTLPIGEQLTSEIFIYSKTRSHAWKTSLKF